jgi:hypothetical protein
MAERKAGSAAVNAEEAEPTKVQLQQRMEQARDTITQTVEEIKETVTDQVESVKETVSDVLDWNEHFSKNPLLWGAAAVGAGLVIGYSVAVMRQGEHHSRRRRTDESVADGLFSELATIGENILLPAVNDRIKQLFGIDLREHLFRAERPKPKRTPPARKKSAQKRLTPKTAAKKKPAGKRASKKKAE